VDPNAPQTNAMAAKLEAADRLIAIARMLGMRIETVDAVGDFWRAREGIDLDVRFGAGGYEGRLRTGPRAIRGLTVELGEAIAAIGCDGCGPVSIAGRRLVFEALLPPNVELTFTAQPVP